MFQREAVVAAIERLNAKADTPLEGILVEFLEQHVAEILDYQPQMTTIDEGLLLLRKREIGKAAD